MLKREKLKRQKACWLSKVLAAVFSNGKRKGLMNICVVLLYVSLRHCVKCIWKFIQGYFPGNKVLILKAFQVCHPRYLERLML
jgi:hypothetical protein